MSSTPGAAAVLVKASGHVYAERNGTRITLAEGDSVQASDIIITDASSTAEVHFADGATASLSPGTTLELKNFVFGEGQPPSFVLNLMEGTMRSISGEVVKQNPDAFKIVTPRATVGIRGTELFNSVQGSDEVHAVLHIGKGHIVLVTGVDGQSITLDSALQAVSMNTTTSGQMVMQTFSPQEMQSIIQQLAPTQLQKPLPGGPDAKPLAPDQQGAEGQPGAEGQAQTAQAAAGGVSTVVLVVEGETSQGSGGTEITLTQTDSNTLITIVETLQGDLADAGFKVESVVAGESAGEYQPFVPPSKGEVANNDPTQPEGPQDPPAPPPPPPPYVLDSSEAGAWATSHVADHGQDVELHVTVNGGLSGVNNFAINAQAGTQGVMGNDTVIINGGISTNSNLYGDALNAKFVNPPGETAPETPPALVFGSDNITVNGSLGAGGFIYGDAQSVDGSGLGKVTFGNDTIHVTGNVEAGASIIGDVSSFTNPGSPGSWDGGKDSITVGGVLKGSIQAGYGDDSVTVGSMNQGTIDGGAGNDGITITGSMNQGTIDGGAGNDTINVGSMSQGGLIKGGDGIDTITVGSSNDCRIDAGAGNDRITVENMIRGSIEGGAGDDNITLNGSALNNGSIYGGEGDNTITVKGDMEGDNGNIFISGGSGRDIVHVTGSLLGANTTQSAGQVQLGEGNNSLTVDQNVQKMDITSGNGNDTLTIGGTMTKTSISTGGGDDVVNVNTMNCSADRNDDLNLGAGNDTLTVGVMNGGRIIGGEGADTLNVGIGTTTGSDHIRIYLGERNAAPDSERDELNLSYGSFSGASNVQVHGLGNNDTVNLGHTGATGGVAGQDGTGMLTIQYGSQVICLNVAVGAGETPLGVFNQLVANGQVTGFGSGNWTTP